MPIPNSIVGLLIRCNKYDGNRYTNIELAGYFDNNKGKRYYNDKISNEELQSFKKQVLNELKPLVDQIGEKFDELVRAKGFITKDED